MTTTTATATGLPDPCGIDIASQELQSLADFEQFEHRKTQLRKLATDLKSRNNLARWAKVDLFAAFLNDHAITPRRRSRRGFTLDLLPSLLIFFPIVITWIGLFAATSAYRQSFGDKALEGMSFLQQWQTGFHGRLSEMLSFDRIALWTLCAVGVLVFFSTVQAVTGRRFEQNEKETRERLLGRLSAALTAADFQLAEFRTDDSTQLVSGAETLRGAANEVRKAAEAANITQQEARESLGTVQQALERVESLAEATLRSEDSVRAAAQLMGDATAGVGVKLGEISVATGAVAAAAADMTRSVSADSGKLRESVRDSVVDSANAIRGAVVDSQREIGHALNGAGTGIRQALDDWRTEGAIYSHRHETTTDHLGLIVGSIEQLMDRTAKSLDLLPATVARFENHSEAAAQRLTQSAEGAFTRLEKSIAETTDRLGRHYDRFLRGVPESDPRTEQTIQALLYVGQSIDLLRQQISGQRPARPRRPWWNPRRWFG
ncbi:hypothetical protein J5X84_07440 [Streptosporangiaceae bacterium NEAU-GS5]|nr:hypothetical protein [Streptosporangiaceae bacterium NEAU-GS5]